MDLYSNKNSPDLHAGNNQAEKNLEKCVHYVFLCSNFSAVLENGIMGPQKILFTTDDEFIKQKSRAAE